MLAVLFAVAAAATPAPAAPSVASEAVDPTPLRADADETVWAAGGLEADRPQLELGWIKRWRPHAVSEVRVRAWEDYAAVQVDTRYLLETWSAARLAWVTHGLVRAFGYDDGAFTGQLMVGLEAQLGTDPITVTPFALGGALLAYRQQVCDPPLRPDEVCRSVVEFGLDGSLAGRFGTRLEIELGDRAVLRFEGSVDVYGFSLFPDGEPFIAQLGGGLGWTL